MADNQIVTNIVATSDFSNLIADVNKVANSLAQLQGTISSTNKQLQAQVAVMNRSFADTIRSTGQFSKHFITLTSDVESFGKNLDSGRLKLRDYFRVYQDHVRTSGGLIRDLAKQQIQMQNAIVQPLGRNAQGLMQFNVHVPRGLDVIKNKTALARQELSIMNKVIQDGGVQLINWGKNTQWAGRQLTVGLTLPLAAFGKAAADAFRQADQELTRLTKVYGDIAGTSKKELSSIRKEVAQTAKELSAAMGVNFSETIALAADIAATGKQGNELLSSIKETTRLAVLGEVDRQEAMKATLAIQSAFKQNTDQLAESINFLNAVENQTSTTLNDLVEAIPKAGPVIKGLGGDVQDLALYLTAMREGGINASEGANALKSALASLINPTDVAVKKFEGFGIDILGIVNKNAGNVTATLFALQGALDKLDPLQKQQAIEQLFGKFQFSRLNALFENLGRQGSQTLQVLDLMKASTMQLGSIADRELAAVTESASGRYKRAVESLRADLAGVGDKFLNIATKLINGLDSIINFLQKLPDPVKNLLTVAGAFTAIAGPVIMLTGVMANFVGYLIKGYGHIKAFLKGGEGFKLLTPQMIAAEKAANLVASSLYSDAKAADILHTSLTRLKNDFLELQTIAAKGSISVQPTLSTAAGSIVIPGGGYRPVDPTNPFVGGMASSHINPRDPKNPATLFGLVPGAEFVNMKIGRTPQIFMEERLPNIPGLTSVSTTLRGKPYDVSTGIVAGEAARYQALMATLGMQSKQEIIELKKTVETGGAISTDFIATFDDLLPITTRLSTNAARQSAAIVAQLQAGKLTVDQARMEIIRINAQLEAALAAEVGVYAAGRGRSIDVTKVPLLDQPVVDPKTGKPNMRALFREGRMQDVMFAVGRATRTRTLGAPYSIETTLPPRFNAGGRVERFGRNNTRVSGPSSINYDDRLGALPENGYVLSQGASRRFPELVALAPYTHTNTPGTITAAVTPAETVFGSGIHSIPGLPERLDQANFGMNMGGRIKKGRGNYGQFKIDPKTLRRAHITDDLSGMVILLPDYINAGISSKGSGVQAGMIATALREMLSQGIDPNLPMIDAATTLGGDKSQASRRLAAAMSELINELDANPERILGGSAHPMSFERLAKGIYRGALRGIRINPQLAGGTNNLFSAVSQIFSRRAGRKITKDRAIELGIIGGDKTGSNILGQIVRRKSGRLSWSMPQQNIGADVPDWARGTALTRLLTTSTGLGTTVSGYQRTGRLFDSSLMESLYARLLRRNSGGSIPGRAGGRVVRGRFGYGDYYQDPFTGLILPTSVQPGQTPRMLPGIHGGNFIPLSSVTSGGMGGVPLTGGVQSANPYMMGALTGRQRMMGMGASMAGVFGGGYLGSQLTGGSMLGYMGGSMLGEFAAIAAFNKLSKTAGDATQKTSLLSRGISLISRLPGPVKLVGVVLAVGGAIKEINDKIKEHRAIINQAFAPTEETVDKLNLKYQSLNDTLKAAKGRIEALEKTGTSLFERNNQTGIPGLTLTIKQLKELQEAVKTDFPDLIDIFNKAKPDEVIGKAAQLKAQFVAGGMSAEDASNLIYTLVAASNDATLAIQAINSKGFKEIKTGAEAAGYAIQVMFDLIEEGNVDQLAAAFDQAYNSLRNYEKSLINTKDDQGEILDRVGALEKTLQLINVRSQTNVELSGKQLEAVKKQNPELRSILGNVEDTAGAYAKIQLYTMGITGNLQDMNSAAAQAKLIAVTGVMSTLESTSGPFASLAKQIAAQQKIVDAAGVKAAKAFTKTKDQINEEIKLRQKNIQKIKEEADTRIKALQEAQEDEDILLKIKEKQLDYQAALAAGDLSGATAAQLEIQGLVGQQQRTLAIRSIQEDADARIKTLEEEIDNLQDKLDAAQSRLDNANDNAAAAAKKLADLQSLMDKAIEAVLLKLNDGVITEAEKAIIESTRKLFKNTNPEIYRLLDPNIQVPFKQSPIETLTESVLSQVLTANGKALKVYITGGTDSILNLFKGDQVSSGGVSTTPSKYEVVGTGSGRKFLKDGKEVSIDEYNKGQYLPGPPPMNAGKAYIHPVAEFRQKNFGNQAAVIKAYKDAGYANGRFTSTGGWVYFNTGKVVGPNGEQGVWYDSRVRSYSKGTTDGPISGPGNGTSDSIIARVSNGEYVTRAVSVSDVGVNNMHLINTKGTQGLLEAARNIVEDNKAMGGIVGYPMGGLIPYASKGKFFQWIGKGLKSAGENVARTFDNVMEYLGLTNKSPADKFPFEPQLAKQYLEEAIDNVTRNIGIIPQKPNDAKQALYLAKMYKNHSKFWKKEAAKYKNSTRTVGEFNSTLRSAKDLLDSGPRIIDNNPVIKDWKDFVANVDPSDFNKPRSPLDKEFFDIVSNPVEGIPADRGFVGRGLDAPDLFGGIDAPGNISLYDYYLGKVTENKLIESVYSDLVKIIQSDPLLARKLGFINPKGFAFGGMVGLPKFKDGGQAKDKNWFQSYVSRLTETNNQLPGWARDPLGSQAVLRKIAGQSQEGDTLSAALFPLTFMGFGLPKTFAKGVTGIGSKVSGAFNKLFNTTPKIPSVDIPRPVKLAKLHADFVRMHPQEKLFVNYLLSKGVEPEEAARQLALRRGGLDFRPRKSLVAPSLWDSPGASEIAEAQARAAKDLAAFEDAMLLFPFAKGEKQFDKLGQILGNTPAAASPAKGMIQDSPFAAAGRAVESHITGSYVNPLMDVIKNAGVSAEYDALVNYIIAREAGKGKGLSVFESTTGAHLDQNLVKTIASIVSEKGLIDTSKFKTVKTILEDNTVIDEKPVRGVHSALMRILRDDSGIKLFEKASHPSLPIKSSYMELFNELYGSRLARYLGIPSPKNTIGFREGDILSPVILSQDVGKLGFETVSDRFETGLRAGLFGSDEVLRNIFKQGYILPEPEILKKQLAEDVGRLAGFISLIKSSDTFQNEGNMIMSKVGARLGAIDFGFAWDSSAPTPDFFSRTSEMLRLKENFSKLLDRAAFNQKGYTSSPTGPHVSGSYSGGDFRYDALTDEEFLKNAYRGITNVAERVGNVSNIKKIIDLVLRDMTSARPDLDLRLPLEMAEQMGSLAKIFKDKSIGKLAGGGYINPSYFSSMSMPSYATGVKYLYDDTIAQLHKGEAVIPENMNPFNPNATAPIGGGNKLVYIAPTINAAPGMDIEQLTDVATRKIVEVMRKAESDYSARAGEKLSMTRRYV